MTALDLLFDCQAAGVVLRPVGDKLQVDAPTGTVTAELRASLIQHKPELIALLSLEWVPLTSGPTVPLDALRVAWSIEERGIQLTLTDADRIVCDHPEALTDADRQEITRWSRALVQVAAYCGATPEALNTGQVAGR